MKVLSRALVVVLLLEIILIFGGVLPPTIAAPLIVITEGTAFCLGGSLIFRAVSDIRKRVKTGERIYVAIEQSLEGVLPPKALFMVKHEIGVFISLGRLIAFKKDLPTSALEIKYGKHMRLFIAILIVASIAEIVAVELLVPWDIIRYIIIFLSIYGLLWIIGLMAATIVYPHYVTRESLVIRFFHFHTIKVPLNIGTRVSTGERSAHENKTIEIRGDVLSLNVLGSTNVSVILPALFEVVVNGKSVEAREITFSANSPDDARFKILNRA